ncbi:Glycosyltransferase 25 family member [Eumeta japonica]|uniref:Glycosyltransferase 25 family member n=1 Tax=Eumeta variegata TaxID=151549 RepID=A0A4C1SPV1_EUMVA|nr:Glycosyltransferase 25 family member [Eumeta japonica]
MKEPGCYDVPMIHSAVLIDLRVLESDKLTYDPAKITDYTGPQDDIIAFAINTRSNNISLNVCNDKLYGFVPVPLEENVPLSIDYHQLLNIKLEAISRAAPLKVHKDLMHHIKFPELSKYSCDEIYMINLERRIERRQLMIQSFRELGMDAIIFRAIGGSDVKVAEGIIILVSDFPRVFHSPLPCLFREANKANYRVNNTQNAILLADSQIVDSQEHIVKPLYSYWTLGYLISYKGAQKLIDSRPLLNLLPVDEYLPIMFDQHPNETWKSHFPKRNLKAFSASPLLVHPTHYTGQRGHISDTEDSNIVNVPGRASIKTEL